MFLWLNAGFHISLAVFLCNYELKRCRWLSATGIHSHTCLLQVKMGRKETSQTSVLFAAAYFSFVLVEINSPSSLWVLIRLFCVAVVSSHQLFSSTASAVAIWNAHYKYAQHFGFFLMDLNCWLFSLAQVKSFYWILSKTCFSTRLLTWCITNSTATQTFVPTSLFNWEIIIFVQNMGNFEFHTFFVLVHYSWFHFFCQIFVGLWDSTQISVLLSWH